MDDLGFLSIRECRAALDGREISSVELTTAALERAEALNGQLNAFLLLLPERAIELARDADRQITEGRTSALTGIPYALKDILSTTGIRTTCGSRLLANYVPVFQGPVIDALDHEGAILIGKTNMDEFAMGSSTEHSGFGPTRNPWDLERVPGGSSGGSAAAVAAGVVPFALGTDTGGSIRQPAALTGTVGVKPSYGRVSRYGLVAFASSLDQIGPFTRTVADGATVLESIAGHDRRDSTSLPDDVPDYRMAAEHGNLTGLRIGVPKEYFPSTLDPQVRAHVRDAIDLLERNGAEIIDISLPTTDAALSVYYIIAPSEAMSNLARYDGVRFGVRAPSQDVWEMFDQTRELGFGSEVKRRILLGAFALSKGYYDAYYVKAQKVREMVRKEFAAAFETVDVIVGPTTPTPAFKLGEKTGDPLAMYLADVFTLPANIAGICGISIPCGLADGLPVGLQVLAPALGEERMFAAAAAYERTADLRLRPPPIPMPGVAS